MTDSLFFTEEEVERYLRAPESISPDVKRRVERALRESGEAKSLAESIRSFYEQMDALQREDGEFVESLLDSLCAGDSIQHLQPVRHGRRASGQSPGRSQMLMAAATEAPGRPRMASTSYGTPQSDVLVRVLHDRFSREHELYVLAEDPERCAFALVSFPRIGLEIATDGGAHASFVPPFEIESEAWAELTAVVRLPLSSSKVDLGSVGAESAGSGGVRGILARDHLVDLSREGEELRIRVTARRRGAPIVSLATLTDSSGRIRLADLSTGEGRIDHDSRSDPHVLRLYA
jgi:hypothetical protein